MVNEALITLRTRCLRIGDRSPCLPASSSIGSIMRPLAIAPARPARCVDSTSRPRSMPRCASPWRQRSPLCSTTRRRRSVWRLPKCWAQARRRRTTSSYRWRSISRRSPRRFLPNRRCSSTPNWSISPPPERRRADGHCRPQDRLERRRGGAGRSRRARRLPGAARQSRRRHRPHQLPAHRRTLRRRRRDARSDAQATGPAGRRPPDDHPAARRRAGHHDGGQSPGRRRSGL